MRRCQLIGQTDHRAKRRTKEEFASWMLFFFLPLTTFGQSVSTWSSISSFGDSSLLQSSSGDQYPQGNVSITPHLSYGSLFRPKHTPLPVVGSNLGQFTFMFCTSFYNQEASLVIRSQVDGAQSARSHLASGCVSTSVAPGCF